MTSRICYLHAGTQKTGTSAIQYALTKTRDHLLSCGLHYPDLSRNFHRVLDHKTTGGNASELVRVLRNDRGDQIIRMLGQYADRPENLVLSSEGLSKLTPARLSELARVLDHLGYDIRCLVFFRPQAQAVVSRYLQRVRGDNTGGRSLDAYVQRQLEADDFETVWNWYARAQTLSKTFGAKNVSVKWYPSVTRPGSPGVVRATLDWMDTILPESLVSTHRDRVNPTPGQEALVVLERLNSQGFGGKDISQAFLNEAQKQNMLGSKVALNPTLLKTMESATRQSNIRLLERYCPELSVESELPSSIDHQQMNAVDQAMVATLGKIASEILHERVRNLFDD